MRLGLLHRAVADSKEVVMLTTCSNIFRGTLAQARECAEEWLSLRRVITSDRERSLVSMASFNPDMDAWEDWQTGGGGCRITHCDGYIWVSRHSGYPQADVTEEACEVLRFLGCEDLKYPDRGGPRNPRVYSVDEFRDGLVIDLGWVEPRR